MKRRSTYTRSSVLNHPLVQLSMVTIIVLSGLGAYVILYRF